MSGNSVKVRIDWTALFLLGWVGFGFGNPPVYILTRFLAIIAVILLHEFGHYWAAIWRGYRVYEIVVHWSGGYCTHEPARNARDRLIISSGGIAVQLLVLLISLIIWTILVRTMDRVPGVFIVLLRQEFIRYNLINLVFNLIPVPPLDGHSIYQSFKPAMKEFRSNGLRPDFNGYTGAKVYKFSTKTPWWKRKKEKKAICPFCGAWAAPGHKCNFSQENEPEARPQGRTGTIVKRIGIVVISVLLFVSLLPNPSYNPVLAVVHYFSGTRYTTWVFFPVGVLAAVWVLLLIRLRKKEKQKDDEPDYQELLSMTKSRDTCERLIQHELTKNPSMTRSECIKRALDRLKYEHSRHF